MNKKRFSIADVLLSLLVFLFSLLVVFIIAVSSVVSFEYIKVGGIFYEGFSGYWATIFAALIGVFGICLTIYFQQKESNKIKTKSILVAQYEVTSASRSNWLDNIRGQIFIFNEAYSIFIVEKEGGNYYKSSSNCTMISPIIQMMKSLENIKLYINPQPAKDSTDYKINIEIEKILEYFDYLVDNNLIKDAHAGKEIREYVNDIRTYFREYLKEQWGVIKEPIKSSN